MSRTPSIAAIVQNCRTACRRAIFVAARSLGTARERSMTSPTARSESIRGSCHCGNIHFVFEWPNGRAGIPARACTCDFCVKHGGRWTSNPQGSVALEIADPQSRALYQFGTNTADFNVCQRCGVVPIVTCTIGDAQFAVVNVNAFVGIDRNRLVVQSISFEEETPASRLERRRRSWTPVRRL
jgi:hypothetical protein